MRLFSWLRGIRKYERKYMPIPSNIDYSLLKTLAEEVGHLPHVTESLVISLYYAHTGIDLRPWSDLLVPGIRKAIYDYRMGFR